MSFLTRRPSVEARRGMVATSETQAAMAGLRVLQEGGNAVDAAVATSAALCVTETDVHGARGRHVCPDLVGERPEGNGASTGAGVRGEEHRWKSW